MIASDRPYHRTFASAEPNVDAVRALCAADCNFNANTVEVGPTESGITVTTTLNMTGTFHYACTIPGHCSGGNMNLQVDVASCEPPNSQYLAREAAKLNSSIPAA
jgi:hypothetical protein